MQAPLEGIKVLDLSRILAGPWATMTLGDLGAEVWKIERPHSGDDTRQWSPPKKQSVSTYYLSANRNKKSVAIDLANKRGRDMVLELARKADIVVENFLPSSLQKLGLDYETLSSVNPRLIYCSISGYGRDNKFSKRAGYDFVLQAETGFMAITGEEQGSPMRLGVAFIDLATGMNAVQAILAALYAREKTGKGQHLDLSLHHCGMHFLANVASGYLNTEKEPARFGNRHPSIVPYQTFDTQDGAIALAIGNDAQYRRMCLTVLDREDLWSDSRFQTNEGRVTHRDELVEKLQAEFSKRNTSVLMDQLLAQDLPAGRILSVSDAFQSEETKARQLIDECERDDLGSIRTVSSPLRFSGSAPRKSTPPPKLGEHSQHVLMSELGLDKASYDKAVQDGIIYTA